MIRNVCYAQYIFIYNAIISDTSNSGRKASDGNVVCEIFLQPGGP